MWAALPGLLLGTAAVFSPGWLFIVLAALGTALLIRRTADAGQRRFLLLLFLIGFAVRALLSLGLDLGSWAATKQLPAQYSHAREWDLGITDQTRHYVGIGDSDYYSARGWALAEYIRGSRVPVVLLRLNQYGWNSYAELIGLFYYVFGFSPSAVKGINCLLGAACGVVVFWIAQWGFGPRVARWSAIGTAFFPSLVFWSASNLKDTSFLFLTLSVVLCFIRLLDCRGLARKSLYALLLAFMLAIHSTLRDSFWLILSGSLIAAALFQRFGLWLWLASSAAALGGGFLLINHAGIQAQLRSVLAQFFHWHIGYAITPGLTYSFLPSSFYEAGYLPHWVAAGELDLVLAALVKAPLHFFLEPLWWRFDSPVHLLPLCQAALWYALLALAAAGLAASLQKKKPGRLYLLFPMAAFSLLIGLTSGNVGTLFRIRDLITPFLLVFSAAGLDWLLRPEWVGSSRVAAAVLSLRGRLLQGAAKQREWGRRTVELIFSGRPAWSSRDIGLLLISAVMINAVLLQLCMTDWTPFNVSFRLGLLAIGLWALQTGYGWTELLEESRLRRLTRGA